MKIALRLVGVAAVLSAALAGITWWKYGLRDWWVSLYVDQTRSSAVRMEPAG